jgi:hypothetical protein
MALSVKIPCDNVITCLNMKDWAKSVNIKIVAHNWLVENDVQHVKFSFKNEKDMTMFLLRWS